MNTLLICIQNESDTMAKLVDVLKQEQTALTQAPSLTLMDDINEITGRKNQLIATISQLSYLRKKELGRLGFKQADSTMPEWLQDQAQIDAWAHLVKHTRKANELNRVNGLLINKHLIRNQSILRVLYQRHNSSPAPALYGADGQSTTRHHAMRGFVA